MAKISVKQAMAGEEVAKAKTLEDLIPEFFEKNTEAKAAQIEADKVKVEAKTMMTALKVKESIVGDYKATLTDQDRSAMNPDKLIKKLKELGYHQAIKMIEVVDETIVQDLLYDETCDLSSDDLADCLEPNIIQVFKVIKVKKKASKK